MKKMFRSYEAKLTSIEERQKQKIDDSGRYHEYRDDVDNYGDDDD